MEIKNWKLFNESNDLIPSLLVPLYSIVDKLGKNNLSDVVIGESLTPYLSFIYNNKPFSVSLTDRLGMSGEYSTIIIIVEENFITETLGSFNTNEIDEVVDVILNY